MPFRITHLLCLGFNKFKVVVAIENFQVGKLTEDIHFTHTYPLFSYQLSNKYRVKTLEKMHQTGKCPLFYRVSKTRG